MLTPLRPIVLSPALDLTARYNDVRRLVCAHPAFRAAVASGKADADDLRQEVLLRIVARQNGRSAWDPERASLGKYVWIVTFCAVSNYLRDQRKHEHLVLTGVDPIDGVFVETHEHNVKNVNVAADGVSQPDEVLDLEEQLMIASDDLGLSAYQRKLVLAAAAGDVRRDDARIVALGAVIRARLAE